MTGLLLLVLPHSPPVDMGRHAPGRSDLFARACELEDLLNARRARLARDPFWLTRFNRTLADAIAEDQPTPFDGYGDGGCDNSSRFTYRPSKVDHGRLSLLVSVLDS